jgi:hypothetical protein
VQKFQQDAIGAIIRTTIREINDAGVLAVVNLASVTQKNFVFRKPSGIVVTKTAAFLTDGADGVLQFVSDTGLFNEAGIYKLQAALIFPGGGYNGPTEIGSFWVLANVD